MNNMSELIKKSGYKNHLKFIKQLEWNLLESEYNYMSELINKQNQNKTMKKSDLKTGMLVQTMEGFIYIVINNTLIRNNGFVTLDSFNDDLSHKYIDKWYNIIKISSVLHGIHIVPCNWTEETLNKYLLWERKEENTYKIDGIEYSESTLISLIKKATNN